MNPIELGKFIASLRNEKNLTQEELAEKLFIDKRKISRWECGMSTPDFDMLIKLTEIFDVSLYELSICQRLKDERITRRVINKFKSIKDFKKYKLKKKILIILTILLGIFFILMTIYTFKYYGTVEIYEFNSLDTTYDIKGTYIEIDDYLIYNINNITIDDDKKILVDLDYCTFDIYNNNNRLLSFKNDNNLSTSNDIFNYTSINSFNKYSKDIIRNKDLLLKALCIDNKKNESDYSIKFQFIKKYDNKLF